jgi:hypothetical protein
MARIVENRLCRRRCGALAGDLADVGELVGHAYTRSRSLVLADPVCAGEWA